MRAGTRSVALPLLVMGTLILAAFDRRERGLAVVVVGVLILRTVTVLVHEFGHAWAVFRLAPRSVVVEVFGFPRVTARIGMMELCVGLWPSSRRILGRCTYDPRGISWRRRGWIALSGPLASFLELTCIAATSPVWLSGPATLRAMLLTTGVSVAALVVINLIPKRLQVPGQNRWFARDGWNARECFANARAGVPPLQPASAQPLAGSSATPVENVRARPAAIAHSGRTLADIWNQPSGANVAKDTHEH